MSALDRYLDDLDQNVDGDTLLTRFLEYTSDQGLELYPAQEEAVMELFVGNNVVLNTRWWRWPPTSVRSRSGSVLFTPHLSRRS